VEEREFSEKDASAQADVLGALLLAAKPQALRHAIEASSPQVKQAVANVFAGLSSKDRKGLYLAVIWILAGLAALALTGAMIAIVRKAESAAFFGFAGLALGGLTGILAPSPTSGSS